MSSNTEKWWSPTLKKVAKVTILVGLLICFEFVAAEVWQKFSLKSTNFKQSNQKHKFSTCPTSTVCFIPSLKKSVRNHYNLSRTVYEIFVESKGDQAHSLWNLFNESSYLIGKDFNIYTMASTNQYIPIELHIGINTVPFCEAQVGDILSLKEHCANLVKSRISKKSRHKTINNIPDLNSEPFFKTKQGQTSQRPLIVL